MNDTRLGRKEKSQHIQVFVRVRPLNENESNTKCTNIIEIPNDEELIVHECPHDKFSKKFKFNSVFGPCSKQIDVYAAVVSPLLDQVLAGYNCTIFAYGQTGTGKTFTMEGINNDHTLSHWRNDSPAGMIPRSLSHIFDKLQSLEAQEYTIRVSFLELYNEDLFDLLSPNDDGTKIKLYEDASKKGTIITHGLEEVTVHNKTEVYKILEKGSERRQTAATLMNAHSSRSHTVFSITVHMKENTVEGEEVLKTGKLNLVDLAGSESIARSGSVDRRAREAGSINQSLLTLGRVITALVERAPHIPYRESKLTRLLQESLGGRTKTSIIATISPANINLEETLSTLDYAHRAKNITNRPEINQKVSKKEFLKQYTEEIERLRRDLLATREKNGVYLANENYNEMQTLIAQQSKEIEEKINRIKALEKNMQDKEKIYNDLELQNIAQMKELNDTKIKLNSAADALNSTNYRLKLTTQERDEQKFLVEKHMNTEQTLLSQAQALLNVADTATDDSHKLHDKIARKTATEKTFEELGERFKNNLTDTVQGIKNDVSLYGKELMQFCLSQKNDLVKEIFHQCDNIDTAVKQVAIALPNQHLSDANNLSDAINKSYSNYEDWMGNETKNNTVTTLESEHELLSAASSQLAQDIDNIIENEFAKYLQTIQNGVTAKFQEAAIFMKDTIDCMCNSELENYNRLNKHLMDIERNVETLCEKQLFTKKQRSFTKMLGATFAHWDDLNKKQEEDFSAIMNKCNRVSDLCSELKRQTTNSCNGNIKTLNDLKDRVRRDMEKIENKVTLRTKENEEVANRITEDGKELINELKTNVNESYDATKHHKNAVECSVKEMRVQMVADKTKASSLIEDARQVVLDACKNHAEFLEDKKTEVSNTFEEISEKLDKQMLESSNRSDDVSVQLEATKRDIHKFFEDDIQRDTSTGSTPAKKEFSYPRQFKATSPHDRILQRFRETRKLVETSEDYDDTNMSEVTMREIANSTAISDVFASPPSDATIIAAVLNNSSAISRIETTTRTLDFASTTVQSHDRSELTASKKER